MKNITVVDFSKIYYGNVFIYNDGDDVGADDSALYIGPMAYCPIYIHNRLVKFVFIAKGNSDSDRECLFVNLHK